MTFIIADTFTDSLGRLTGEEQKAIKTTAFDLQLNPANPGMSFHKLDKAKDKNFWSVRVTADLRLIVHKTADSLLLCYVDHHDAAYAWAQRRKLEAHPKTGAAQFVEIRESVQEIIRPVYIEAPERQPVQTTLFANVAESDLLSYGVPPEWMKDVRNATEDSLLDLADHLPAEASEALLQLATGGRPRPVEAATPSANPFDHPDAQRRFRVMANMEELQRALDCPWDKWTVFLHPEQRRWVERDYSGPARVSGSAGTGKTIVALHRAVFLARTNPDSRVLLTTFSETLANALRTRLRRLVCNEPQIAERLEVLALSALGARLHRSLLGKASIASSATIHALLATASKEIPDHAFSARFLETEWEQVVDAWQLESWEAYRDVARLGRKTRLSESGRKKLWAIFQCVREGLNNQRLMTEAGMFSALAKAAEARRHPPFDFVVVDEAQDLAIPHVRLFAAMGGERANALFFAGDLGQRIFQQPFSWKALGVDVRGRSRTLRVNYRTSHQIRRQADRLLAPEVVDVDGNVEVRGDAISIFNGAEPEVRIFDTEDQESNAVGAWLAARMESGIAPHECGVFVRSEAQIGPARAAAQAAGVPFKVLDEHVDTAFGHISLCTMHLAKGLEFRAVAVMACDDEVIPLQSRIESIGDQADLQDVYDTERHLLYVACTRARDHLLVTSTAPASEFLDDLTGDA